MDMTIIRTMTIAAALAVCTPAVQVRAEVSGGIETFPVSSVRLTGGDFRHAQDMDIRYLLAIDPDRLLAPYLKGAGLEPKAENYPNWENTGLDGHIGGHYLSALSYMYASTGNGEIKDRLDYMVSQLKECAEASGNGYVAGVLDGPPFTKHFKRSIKRR